MKHQTLFHFRAKTSFRTSLALDRIYKEKFCLETQRIQETMSWFVFEWETDFFMKFLKMTGDEVGGGFSLAVLLYERRQKNVWMKHYNQKDKEGMRRWFHFSLHLNTRQIRLAYKETSSMMMTMRMRCESGDDKEMVLFSELNTRQVTSFFSRNQNNTIVAN